MCWLAGAFAGLLADVFVHPIDLIRARLQTQSLIRSGSESTAPYQSARHAFRVILKEEGPRGLYKGFAAVAVGTVPGHALYFATYEISKRLLYARMLPHASEGGETRERLIQNLGFWERASVHFVAGFVADAAGSLTWTPMDVIKQRLQIQRDLKSSNPDSFSTKYQSSMHAFRIILRDEGVRGLYRGFWAGLMTFGPYVSLYFMFYEQFKHMLLHTNTLPLFSNPWLLKSETELPFYTFLIGAGLSGGVSACLTCPLDVVKTRMQVQQKSLQKLEVKAMFNSSSQTATSSVAAESPVYYRSWFHACQTILRNEGPRAFMQGVGPRALWMSMGTALTMMIYEEMKKILPYEERK